ncbi:MAG: class I SAM-dependent methyltransferase [Deltaproteobacteria bacterium]|nr:class I SAM-dependent methyltransferase [Deltaproteobacteria bacterium]
MILKVVNGKLEQQVQLEPFNYAGEKKILGHVVLPITRWLRAQHAKKYMKPLERHLDIGCGDGYFLKRSSCKEAFGVDKRLQSEVSSHLEFPNQFFDYVTMLAVIEHIHDPKPLLGEIARVLKPKGRLIITTPRKMADHLIKFYANDIDEEHVAHYTIDSIQELTSEYFSLVGYRTFILGLNQIFCLERK